MLQSFNGTARDLIDLVEETVIASKGGGVMIMISTSPPSAVHLTAEEANLFDLWHACGLGVVLEKAGGIDPILLFLRYGAEAETWVCVQPRPSILCTGEAWPMPECNEELIAWRCV